MTSLQEISILQTLPGGDPLAPGHALIEITNVAAPERDVRIRIFDESRRQYLQADGSFADTAHLLAAEELKYFEDHQSFGIVLGPMLVASIDPEAWVTLEIPELGLKQGLFWPELIAGLGGPKIPGTQLGKADITRHFGAPAQQESQGTETAPDDPNILTPKEDLGAREEPDQPPTPGDVSPVDEHTVSGEDEEDGGEATDAVDPQREALLALKEKSGTVPSEEQPRAPALDVKQSENTDEAVAGGIDYAVSSHEGVGETGAGEDRTQIPDTKPPLSGTNLSGRQYGGVGNDGSGKTTLKTPEKKGDITAWVLSFAVGLVVGAGLVWAILQVGQDGSQDTAAMLAATEAKLATALEERDAAVEEADRLRQGLAEEAQRQIEQAEAAREAAEADRNAANARAENAERQLADADRALTDKTAERDAAVEEAGRLREGLGDEAQRQIAEAEADRDAAAAERDEAISARDAATDRANAAEAELADAREKAVDGQNAQDAASQQVVRANEERDAAIAERDAAIEERDAAIAEASRPPEGVSDEARQQIAQAEAARESAQARANRAESDLADAERALEEARAARDEALRDAEAARSDPAGSEADTAELDLYQRASLSRQEMACDGGSAGVLGVVQSYGKMRNAEIARLRGLMCDQKMPCVDAFKDILDDEAYVRNQSRVYEACMF